MTDCFFDGEGEELEDQWVRGFLPPGDGRRFASEAREMTKGRLKGAEARAFALIGTYPLISKACVRDVLGAGEAEAVEGLFLGGAVTRFCEIDRTESGDEKLTKAVYHVSEGAERLMGRAFLGFSYPPAAVAAMTGTRKCELSSVSEYAARACAKTPGGRLLSLVPPGREKPWLEALIQKRTAPPYAARGARCLFHVVRRPLERERVPAFLETLLFLNELMGEEERAGIPRVRSRAVILCESDDDMEQFAAFLSRFLKERKLAAEAEGRFLFALEGDACDKAGPFKFLSRITFEEGTIKKSQVAFR